MIKVTQTGEFNKITRYLERSKHRLSIGIFDKYGKMGVDALTAATPVDTGKTADSWRYEIQNDANGTTLSFHNDNVNKGVNIAIILQYGHGTGNGGWVEGRDYINPALQPIFDELADKIWKEVTKV